MSLVTVVVPAYNRANTLSRCIQSIIAQTFTDWKIILVDDGSTDNTTFVAKQFEEHLSAQKFEFIRLDRNSGACVARNIGIKAASSDYVCFLDSDDAWLPEILSENVSSFVNDPEIVASYTDLAVVSHGGVYKQPTRYGASGFCLREVLEQLYLCTPSTLMVRSDVCKSIGGFDIEFSRGCNDDDFCIRVAGKGKIKYIDKILALFYTDASGRISDHPIGQIDGRIKLLKKYEELIASECGYSTLIMHYSSTYDLLKNKFLRYLEGNQIS